MVPSSPTAGLASMSAPARKSQLLLPVGRDRVEQVVAATGHHGPVRQHAGAEATCPPVTKCQRSVPSGLMA